MCNMNNQRIVRRSSLRGVDLFRRLRVERVRAESVDRLSRKGNEPAVPQDLAAFPKYFVIVHNIICEDTEISLQ